MKLVFAIIPVVAGLSLRASAYTGRGVLTLTTPAGTATENKLEVTISTVYNGQPLSDKETTTVSGTLNVDLNANPQSGATTGFTIQSGNIAMTNMAFTFKVFILTVAAFNTSGMKGTAFTLAPPGLATPSATGGTFDAALHYLRIDQGTITGTALGSPINTNFADSPVEGPGSGTGNLTVIPGSISASHRLAAVTLILPVDFSDTQDLNGNIVTVRVKGTIKATGSIPVPLNSWIDWTDTNHQSGAAFNSITAPGAAPLGLAWAMGYEPGAPATAVTPVMIAGATPSARVTLSSAGSRAPVTLEQSQSLTSTSWQVVPAAMVSGGLNPLPAGTRGPITVQWATPLTKGFLRLRAQQP